MTAPVVETADGARVDAVVHDPRPPGDRYYRHPGDAVRLVLWGLATVAVTALIGVGTATTEGLTTDLGRVGEKLPTALRELALALAQVLALVAPAAVVVLLAARGRWRRLGVVVLASAAGAALLGLLDAAVSLHGRLPGAVSTGTWVASARFPSLLYVAGAAAAAMVGKPWLARSWRRASDVGLAGLVIVMALAGSAGAPALLLAVAAGCLAGATVLVVLGAPNRRPSPAAVAHALREGGLEVSALTLQRAEGGRAQLYVAELVDSRRLFVKVYGHDSRDADLLYRGYRGLLLRRPDDGWLSQSLKHDVEHEGLLLLLAREAGVACPRMELLASLPDGSMALALEHVAGRRLDSLDTADIDSELLGATWSQVAALHRGRIAHRALRAGNVLVSDGPGRSGHGGPGRSAPVLIDLGFAAESAPARLQAIDRAELLASMGALGGPEPVIEAALRVLGPVDLVAAVPYLQPLALSAATRRGVSKSLLQELRSGITTACGVEAVPLERLVRVRGRHVLTIAALMGAFYFLLPQLADVDDSFRALGSANWAWLGVCALMSLATYMAAAVAMTGGVPDPIPLGPTVGAQMASSFVNRITPANVGGMTLNVRFLQRAGVEPATAVTAVGLNSVAGGIVHAVLMVVFFAWAGRGGQDAFTIPSGSKLLVVIAVLLAVLGVAAASRRGRRLVRTHVVANLKRSFSSIAMLARSPGRLAALFGGSTAITLAYICALAAAVAAFHGGLSIAEVGAVYLGSSAIAAAAPTPGGLGALEAALVAGLTGVGMGSGEAVAAVLSYRLVTYWLPIVPGWASFRVLERRGYI